MLSLNKKGNWNIRDKHPGVPIDAIEPLCERASALVFRSSSPLLESDFMQIAGVCSILHGMTYHYKNFLALINQESAEDFRKSFSEIRHESVAWVNRVGQLYYFVRSKLVRAHLGKVETPAIDKVMPFRHKHAAHRSFDKPQRGDNEDLRVLDAMSMSDFGFCLWQPKPGGLQVDVRNFHQRDLFDNALRKANYLAFQIQGRDGDARNLVLEQDHPVALSEGYGVLSRLLS